MRYLLDTDIISDIAKPAPSASLLAWMSEQDDEDLFIASLTVGEIRRGILEKPAGKRRDQLEAWFSAPEARRHCSLAAYCPSTRTPAWSGRAHGGRQGTRPPAQRA